MIEWFWVGYFAAVLSLLLFFMLIWAILLEYGTLDWPRRGHRHRVIYDSDFRLRRWFGHCEECRDIVEVNWSKRP